MSLEIGQRVRLDLFGLRLPGPGDEHRGEGTVIGLGPGIITVQVERADGALSEVTVSLGRVER
jgi:hypothetical protein